MRVLRPGWMGAFRQHVIGGREDFFEVPRALSGSWAFRGQRRDVPLCTTLELACAEYDIDLAEASGIEQQLIRAFRRQYEGADRDLVMGDMLYCLALMRHHGAPARLLDWTYSFYIAAYFALDSAAGPHFVWAVREDWCAREADRNLAGRLSQGRNRDAERSDDTFRELYVGGAPRAFVAFDNPLKFNRRQIIQQGVFLCPGDVTRPFEENLKAMRGWDREDAVVQFRFDFGGSFTRADLIEELHRMNINHASLFPGLDGFAHSLKHRLRFFRELAAHGPGTQA